MALYRDTPLSYADWAQDHGLARESWTADPEKDEATNLAEYVFDGDPLAADQPVIQDATPTGAYVLELPGKRDDARITIEYSSDLAAWTAVAQMDGTSALTLLAAGTAAGFTASEQSGAAIELTVAPPPAAAKAFFRTRISLIPAT